MLNGCLKADEVDQIRDYRPANRIRKNSSRCTIKYSAVYFLLSQWRMAVQTLYVGIFFGSRDSKRWNKANQCYCALKLLLWQTLKNSIDFCLRLVCPCGWRDCVCLFCNWPEHTCMVLNLRADRRTNSQNQRVFGAYLSKHTIKMLITMRCICKYGIYIHISKICMHVFRINIWNFRRSFIWNSSQQVFQKKITRNSISNWPLCSMFANVE